MPIKYKINLLEELKKKGYTTYRLRMGRWFGQSTVQRLKLQEPVSFDVLDTLCKLLDCQPGDILVYVDEQGGSSNAEQKEKEQNNEN